MDRKEFIHNQIDPTHFVFITRRGGKITRFHTCHTIQNETVATHTYNLMCLVDIVCEGNPGPNLLRGAMYHDQAEQITGDIPATMKWASPNICCEVDEWECWFESYYQHFLYPNPSHRMSLQEYSILKYCDMLELFLFVYTEKILGNRSLDNVFQAASNYIEQLTPPNKIAEEIWYLVCCSERVGGNLIDDNAIEHSLKYIRERANILGLMPSKVWDSASRDIPDHIETSVRKSQVQGAEEAKLVPKCHPVNEKQNDNGGPEVRGSGGAGETGV